VGLGDAISHHHAEHLWREYDERLQSIDTMISMARDWHGFENAGPDSTGGISLQAGENLYFTMIGSALIEARTSPGHYEGYSQGVSFRVMKGVNYRVGHMQGHYVPGPEAPAAIDVGTTVITSKRIVFMGSKQTREWLFSKVVGVSHSRDGQYTSVAVSNRQKTDGFSYNAANAHEAQFRLDLALTDFKGTRASVLQQLEAQRTQVLATRPQVAPPDIDAAMITATGDRPAGWYHDVVQPGMVRYWDGSQWGDEQAQAPTPPPPPSGGPSTFEATAPADSSAQPPTTGGTSAAIQKRSKIAFWLGLAGVIVAALPFVGVIALIPLVIALVLAWQVKGEANYYNDKRLLKRANNTLFMGLLGLGISALWVVLFVLLSTTGTG